jgi:hypothetical protein
LHALLLKKPLSEIEKIFHKTPDLIWKSGLHKFPYIGMNRPITHTIQQLQAFSKLAEEFRATIHARGISVPMKMDIDLSWYNGNGLFMESSNEMGGAFSDFLPWSMMLSTVGGMSHPWKYENEILTTFVQMRGFCKNPELGVSWPVAFAFHCWVTAVIEVRGSECFTFLAVTSRLVFENYMRQVEGTAETLPTTIPWRSPNWTHNMEALLQMRCLGIQGFDVTKSQEMLSTWNPLCAGTILSFAAYYGSLYGGMTLIDHAGQLRVTLHLYHALRNLNAILPGQARALDLLYDSFRGSKRVFGGPVPKKGQYTFCWLIAFGLDPKWATELVNNGCAAQEWSDHCYLVPNCYAPEDLSVSYREVCMHDYRYNAFVQAPQPPYRRASIKFAGRLVDTLDAIDSDTPLLATNIVALGHYLNQFYIDLFVEWGLMERVEEHAMDAMQGGINSKEWWMYNIMGHVFGQEILHPLDCGDELVTKRCARFMVEYFNNIPEDGYMWFTP